MDFEAWVDHLRYHSRYNLPSFCRTWPWQIATLQILKEFELKSVEIHTVKVRNIYQHARKALQHNDRQKVPTWFVATNSNKLQLGVFDAANEQASRSLRVKGPNLRRKPSHQGTSHGIIHGESVLILRCSFKSFVAMNIMKKYDNISYRGSHYALRIRYPPLNLFGPPIPVPVSWKREFQSQRVHFRFSIQEHLSRWFHSFSGTG